MGYVPTEHSDTLTIYLGDVYGCVINAGSHVVTTGVPVFTPSDVGRTVTIIGAGVPTPGINGPNGKFPVSSGSWAAGVATLDIGTHSLTVGQLIQVVESTPSGYDALTTAVTAVTATTVSYLVAFDPGAWASGSAVYFSSAALLKTTIVSLDVTHPTTKATLADAAITGQLVINNNLTVYRPIEGEISYVPQTPPIHYNNSLTQKATLSFGIITLDGSLQPPRGKPVWMYDSADDGTGHSVGDVFGGFLDKVVKANMPGNPHALTIQCDCVDWAGLLTRRLVGSYNSTYGGLSLLDTARAVVYGHADDEGFLVEGVDGPMIPFVQYDYGTDNGSALDDLCSRAFDATHSYFWFVDPWKVIHVVLQTSLPAPWDINDDLLTDGNILVQVTVEETGEKKCNRAYVSATQELQDPITETFLGDGSSFTFNTSAPVGAAPTVTLNGQAQTVGVRPFDTGRQWYWTYNSSAIEQSKETDGLGGFLVMFQPISNKQSLSVTYQGYTKAEGWSQFGAGVDAEAAIEGGTGFCDLSISISNPTVKGDAQAIAEAAAESGSSSPLRLTVSSYRGGLKIAQHIGVKLSQFNIDRVFLIDLLTMDTQDRLKLWTADLVAGPLIGDWRDAIINLTGKQEFGGAGPQGSNVGVIPLGEWAPYQEQAAADDALFPSEWTFSLAQVYPLLADGPLARATLTGHLPVNLFIPGSAAPVVKKSNVLQAITGGFLRGRTAYRVQVCGVDAAGGYTPPSDFMLVETETGGDTNKFDLTEIAWPAIDGLVGYILFASDVDDLICGQFTGVLTGDHFGYSPTTISVTGPFQRSTYGVGNGNIAKLQIKGRRLIHGGVLGAAVSSVDGSLNQIVSTDTVDFLGTDNWAGRVLTLIGRSQTTAGIPTLADGTCPWAAFNITAFDPSTGVFTLDRNPAGIVDVGDAFVVCFKGYDNSADPLNITDAGLANATTGHVGESVDDPNRIGNFVQVIKGKSRGATAKIVANTHTGYTLDAPIVIDATSVWIVVTAVWENGSHLDLLNADPLKTTELAMDLNNYNLLPVVIEGVTVGADGQEAGLADAPVRMLYVFGTHGTSTYP